MEERAMATRCWTCSKPIDTAADTFIKVDEFGPRIEMPDSPEDPSFTACSWRCVAEQATDIAADLADAVELPGGEE
jgi:hypothetical protein